MTTTRLLPFVGALLFLCVGSASAVCQIYPDSGATFSTGNVIYNPGFEVSTGVGGADNWGALPLSANITTKVDPAISNSRFGVATNRIQGEGPSQLLRAYIGNGVSTYRFHAWVRLGGTFYGSASVTLSYLIITPMDKPVVGDAFGPVTASTSCWTQITGEISIPYDAATKFIIYFKGPAASYDLYVDNVALYPKKEEPEDLPVLRG